MISVIIPTLNAAKSLVKILSALRNQSTKPDEVIIVDSSSEDDTVGLASAYGAVVITMPRAQFDHGGTRTLAGKKAAGDILIYITQDAVPADNHAVENLVKPFYADEFIGAVYGRQLPHEDASPFGAHLRMFNYPPTSCVKTFEDRHTYGIKTASLSNSFAAYRKSALEKIGWFKEGMIMGEDVYAGAKLLIVGYKLAYVSEAMVYHSHNYTCLQEFKRYFTVGVFHRGEAWILQEFGKATSEGRKYVVSELLYLREKGISYLIPLSLIRNGFKFIGYQLGLQYDKLPLSITKRCSRYE